VITHMDMESYGFDEWDSTGALFDMKSGLTFVDNIDPRYAGLNRASDARQWLSRTVHFARG